MKIEVLKIDEITPYENNAKLHPKEQIEQIKKSILDFGNNDPIAIDKNNVIIEGHGRFLALQELGYKEVEVIKLDHLTDEQKKAYTLVHNKLTMNSDFDLDILKAELESINEFNMEDYDFGIELEDLEQIEETEEALSKEVKEDDYEVEVPKNPKAKYGDVYQLGRHRLMCGDSTKNEDVEKLMNGEKANMLFTDPPYGYNFQSNMRTEKFDVLINDDKILDFIVPIKECVNGFIFVCTTWKVLDKWIPLFNKYYNLTNMIIWNKGGGGIGDLKHTFATDYEIILCCNNKKEITGKRIGSVWSIQKDNNSDYIHPTQKPVKLSATAIENTTNENENVLDVFGGSGSTLIACEQLNRNCFMMELDPQYVDVIIDRWETFTGEKAVLL